MMKRRNIGRALALTGIAALALALNAGGAAAGPKGKQYGKIAAKSCAKERKAMGSEAFGELYGKPAMPNCIGVAKGKARSDANKAAKECKAEALKAKAFGNCVSGKVKSEIAEDSAKTVNAAKECKAEQAEIGAAAFAAKYGGNRGRGNAFGKCVAGKVSSGGSGGGGGGEDIPT